VCVSNAIQVAEIISQYRRRFPIQRIFVTGLQHVGTAATALMAEVSMLQSEQDATERKRLLGYLREVRDTMHEMTEMYQPAVLMTTVVGHFIRDSGGELSSKDDTANSSTQTGDLSLGSASKMPINVPSSTNFTRASALAPPDLSFQSSSQPLTRGSVTRGTATPVWGFQNSHPPFESSGGLPFLPSSWFEEMNWEEDTEFLNLMGLKDLQNAGLGSLGTMGDLDMEGLGGSSGGGLYDGP
jgi:hypothetical protein